MVTWEDVDTTQPSAEALQRVPLFPLPNGVLFPGAIVPLHMFEPRYQAMTTDAVGGAGLIALAALKPGYEADYEGSPAVFPTMCVGRIVAHRRLDDGRWNIALLGLCRCTLEGEYETDRPYRLGALRRCEETPLPDGAPKTQILRQLLRQVAQHDVGARPEVPRLLAQARTGGQVADIAAALYGLDFDLRQRMLSELDAGTRVDAMIQHVGRHLLEQANTDGSYN